MIYPKFYGPGELPESLRTSVDALLPRLTEGDHPALRALRAQLPHLRVSRAELTGGGFYVDFEVDGDVPLAEPRDFTGGDARITLANVDHGAGCVLFVRAGRIVTLEGYTFGPEVWTEDARVLSIEDVTPIYPG